MKVIYWIVIVVCIVTNFLGSNLAWSVEDFEILVQFSSVQIDLTEYEKSENPSDIIWADSSVQNLFESLGLSKVRAVFTDAKEYVIVDGYRVRLPNFKNYFAITVDESEMSMPVVTILEASPEIILVDAVFPNGSMVTLEDPPDEYWDNPGTDETMWWLHGDSSDPAVYSIHAPEAWRHRVNDTGIGVGILDEGVFFAHEDLTATGDGHCCGTSQDCLDHGTHMCGLIAANRGYYDEYGNPINDQGMVGVLDGASVFSFNIRCVNTATEHGEQIISAANNDSIDFLFTASYPIIRNASFYFRYNATIRRGWQTAFLMGKPCIAAVGNLPRDEVTYPANYGLSVIGVGIADKYGTTNNSSTFNTGTNLKLLGPGRDMFTTHYVDPSQTDTYGVFSGSSSASAVVAGAVGVMQSVAESRLPEMTFVGSDYLGLLIAGSIDLGVPGWDSETGWGRLDLGNSVRKMVDRFKVETGLAGGGEIVETSNGVVEALLYDFEDYGLVTGQIYPVEWFKIQTQVNWASSVAYLDSVSCWGRYLGSNGFAPLEDKDIHRYADAGAGLTHDLLFNINYSEALLSTATETQCDFVTYAYRVYHQDYPNNTTVLANLGPVFPDTTTIGYGVTGQWIPDLNGTVSSNETWSGVYWVTGDIVISSGTTVTIDPGTKLYISDKDYANLGTDSDKVEIIVEGTLVIDGVDGSPVIIESGGWQKTTEDWYGIVVDGNSGGLSGEFFQLRHAEYGIFNDGVDIDLSHATIDSCGIGIFVLNSGGSVQDSEIKNCSDKGVYCYADVGANTSVSLDNVFSHDNMYGFYFGLRTDDCEILNGSKAEDNTLSGIYCRSRMDIGPRLEIRGNGQDGILMTRIGFGAAGLVDSVKVFDHDFGAGIRVDSLASPVVRFSEIRNNFSNVVVSNVSYPVLGDVASSTGGNNWFDGAEKYDVANHVSGFTVKAENCYWGPLVGGVPKFSTYGSVDIIPWLLSEPAFNWVRFQDTPTGGSRILAAYPNPFNPTVRIDYHVASRDEHVEMVIFDLMGRRVRTLVNENKPSGQHSVYWNGKDQNGLQVGAGVYFCKAAIGGYEEVMKLVLVK